jgi:hypothetical protein
MQTPDCSTTTLPRAVSAALECLDITLEDELALYRNQKSVTLLALRGQESPEEEHNTQSIPVPSADQESRSIGQEEQDLDLDYQEPEVVYAELEAGFVANEGQSLAGGKIQPFSESQGESDFDQPPESLNSGELQETDQDLPQSDIDEPTSDESSIPPAATQLPKPYGVEGNPLPESFEKFLDPSIDDYLESSEGLLKHLENSGQDTEQRVQQSTQKSWKIAGLLGLGVGILLSVIWLISGYFKPPSPPPEIPQEPLSPATPGTIQQTSPFPSISPTGPVPTSPLAPSTAIPVPNSPAGTLSPIPTPVSPDGTSSPPTPPLGESPPANPSPAPEESPAPSEPPL